MKLLDICCGAGGAAMGYYRAGFSEIVGVDIDPQPRYPFTFWQMDARNLTYENLAEFDFIHASPPCQQYSRGSALARRQGKTYPDLVEPVRHMLVASGKPWIIENVVGAPVRPDICLCGTMFGLGVIRHRYFETNMRNLASNLTCQHNGSVIDGDYVTVAGNGGKGEKRYSRWAEAMGIDWMKKAELREAIPPAYTEHIGKMVLDILSRGNWEMRTGTKETRIRQAVTDTPFYAWNPRIPGL